MNDPATAAPAQHETGQREPADARQARRWLWLGVLLPALVWNCWRAPFLDFDDGVWIRDDVLLQPETPLSELWKLHPHEQFYYPLTQLSWRADRAVWTAILGNSLGENAWPAGIRITNLLLHALSAWLVWLILRRIGAGAALAAFVAAAFALHPSACETVCWTIERKNALAGALGFASLYVYLRAQRSGGFALAALLFGAANLAKPSALGVLPIVVCWELLGRPRLRSHELRESSDKDIPSPAPLTTIFRLLPWFVIAGAITWIGIVAHQKNLLAPAGGSVGTAILTDAVVFVRYFSVALIPSLSSAYYAIEPITRLSDPQFWLNATIVVSVMAGTVLLAQPHTRRVVLWSWLWYVGGVGPTLNLIGLNDLMHDRFAYLSSPAFWLALGLALQGAAARLPSLKAGLHRVAAPAIVCYALLLAGLSLDRGAEYADSLVLFRDAIDKEPNSSYAQIFYGQRLKNAALKYADEGKQAEVSSLLQASRQHLLNGMAAPDYNRFLHKPDIAIDLAQISLSEGHLEDVVSRAEALLNSKPTPAHASKAKQLLGQVAMKQQDYPRAVKLFHEAAQLGPPRGIVFVLAARAVLEMASQQTAAGNAAEAARLQGVAQELLQHVAAKDMQYPVAQRMLKSLAGK